MPARDREILSSTHANRSLGCLRGPNCTYSLLQSENCSTGTVNTKLQNIDFMTYSCLFIYNFGMPFKQRGKSNRVVVVKQP